MDQAQDSRLYRNNSYWDDLRFPAQGINPASAVDPPSVDNDDPASVATAVPGTLLFAGNVDNMIAGVAQLPHTWREGTAIYPHIHWALTAGSAAAVTWELRIRLLGDLGAASGSWAIMTLDASKAVSSALANVHQITAWAPIDMAGKKVSTMVAWALYRRGSTDANNDLVRLYELDFHYQVNSMGSDLEYRKSW